VTELTGARAPSGLAPWVLAARPRTLPIAASPVLLGTALAWRMGSSLSVSVFLATLLAALAIQAGTNLFNDAADAERGVDGPTRQGPPRATAMGWLRAEQVRSAGYACFALAALLGLHLVAIGGWPILAIGVLSLLAGLAYSSGPRPISFTPLGEVFVLAFFGVAAVAGTCALQAGHVSGVALAMGVILGLFAAAVLHLNNTRDAVDDARAGRATLAILLGPRRSLPVYAALVLAPYPMLAALAHMQGWTSAWLGQLTLPVAALLIRRVYAARSGPDFNRLLAGTAQLELAFAGLMCLAFIV